MIGDTLADPNDPRPLPPLTVDEPSISITIGINTAPLSGRSGKKLTARLIKNRLDQELVGNVSVRMLPTDRPDTWEMQGRGELALAILVEQLRREEFELTVGRPTVVTKEIDGKLHEPVERVTIDVPGEYVGTLTQALATRRARLENLVHHDTGWARMEYIVPVAWPDRVPHRVPHRDPRHRRPQPQPRGLRAVAGRHARPPDRLAGRRPAGRRDDVLDVLAAGARLADGPAGHRGLRGHDRR